MLSSVPSNYNMIKPLQTVHTIVRTKVDRIVDTTVEIIVHTIMHTKVTIIVRNMVKK